MASRAVGEAALSHPRVWLTSEVFPMTLSLTTVSLFVSCFWRGCSEPTMTTSGPATTTSTTLRLTQQHQGEWRYCWFAITLPRNEQGPQRLRSVPLFDNLHLENSFEDNGVSGQQLLDLLALEDDVFPAVSLSAAAPHSAAEIQTGTGDRCGYLLRYFAATADLPLHCALFSRRLLDVTHRWCSETEGPDIEEGDVYSLAAAAYICINCTPPGTPDPAPFQRLLALLTFLSLAPFQDV